MKVKLSLLDKIKADGWIIGYNDKVIVSVAGATYERIGSCTVFIGADGCHYGDMQLDREVDENLYYYYTNLISEYPKFWFEGLQLHEKELPNKPTTQLKDMIIG